MVWHGADSRGQRLVDAYCDDWDSDSAELLGTASSLVKNRLLGSERYACSNSFVLLCAEITARSDLVK